MKNGQPRPNETTVVSNPSQPALQAEPVSSSAAKSEADQLGGGEVHELSEFSKTPDSFGILRLIGWPFQKIARIIEWFFGVASMICLLTLCAAIPLLQFITLGYLLEISANIVRQGKVRAGFVGIRKAARIGGLLLGTTLVWMPAFQVSGIFHDAQIVLADAEQLQPFGINLTIVILITISYTLWAWIRGGKLRHFLWPAPMRFFRTVLKRDTYLKAVQGFWGFIDSLQLKALFTLGFRGFLGAALWLLLPILLCIGGTLFPAGLRGISTLLGLPILAIVLIYLPILQTRFAVENDFNTFRDIKSVRAIFKRAPIALWISMLSVWAFALPVYLAKIQLTPREVFLLPTVIFVIFAWPSRMLM
ncbi:MAG: hypothetical protein CMJ55_06715, partial [Planctomycetaceae bacterium]|nr:hypothetical protein [Planctomycetaceae bacterium]